MRLLPLAALIAGTSAASRLEAGSGTVINTWPFVNATAKAWSVLQGGGSPLDAVEQGCTVCEVEQCDGTVGFGGSPDSTGETTLDACIMDGDTMDGAGVGYLRRVKQAISVARAVMEHTAHTLLAGNGATAFAKMMGFPETNLSTPHSEKLYTDWRAGHCQPNYFRDVVGQNSSCPPYKPLPPARCSGRSPGAVCEAGRARPGRTLGGDVDAGNHDTIGMIVLDGKGHMAAGTTTNGANHKVAGRVGDSPILGSGAYVDSTVGGAAATGDGDVMMRFLPALRAVQLMEGGMAVKEACEAPLRRIGKRYPDYKGAMVCMSRDGDHAGAAFGWTFHYSVRNATTQGVQVIEVPPLTTREVAAV